MEVFDRRNPTVREVAVAVDAIFREGLDIPQTSSWLSFVKDGLLSFEDEDDLESRQELLELVRKLLVCCVIEVHNPNLAAYVEHYVDNLSLDKLLVQLQEYLKQIAQFKHDGPEKLSLWEQAVTLADCVFLYVYKCTREGPEALNKLTDWVPLIAAIACTGVEAMDANGGRADTVTALMVGALMAVIACAREGMLYYVEESIARAPPRLRDLLHTARDAPMSRRLRASDLAQSYVAMRGLIVSAARFSKAALTCEDELEVKDCMFDVLRTCLDATWASVADGRARDPSMRCAMAEACTLVGAMYPASPANAFAFMHSDVFACMDEEFRQDMYAATGRTEASYFVMLADIVSSRETADRVYQLLLGRGQGVAVTWDTLFDRFQGDEWTLDRHETALPVLQLTCKVVRHSEAARTALAFTKWRYIAALLKSSCQSNVDASARDVVYGLLEAFAMTPSIAANVWILLTQAFAVRNRSTIAVPDGNHPSFLRLLAQLLVSSDLSATSVSASAANTAPDLTAYRGYVRDQLSMAVERGEWTIAEPALHFSLRLLHSYAADERDHEAADDHTRAGRHPGWYAMHSLLLAARPNRVLDAVLGSMCDAVALSDAVKLAEHDKTYNREELEDAKAHEACVLAAMRIMEAVLQEQMNFMRRLPAMELDNYVRCFEDLLLADGPNYVGAVAKFLWYSADLELSLAAVRVLARLCESPRARPHLRQKIDETAAVRQTATEGVVLRLEARKVDVCAWLPSAAHRPDIELIKVVREELVELLLYNLRHVPGINMAHVFLGYATVDSGVEAPFTPFEGQEACIDYILDMLADGAASALGPVLSRAHPRIYEMLWELLHALCVSQITASATMCRLEARAFIECKECATLRRQVVNVACPACGTTEGTNTSFLCACVANMVLRDGAQSPKSDGSADSIACLLHQAAWMLKIIALELHLRTVEVPVSQDRKMAAQYLLHCLLPSGILAETDDGPNLLRLILGSVVADLAQAPPAGLHSALAATASFKVHSTRGVTTYDVEAYQDYVEHNRQRLGYTAKDIESNIAALHQHNDRAEIEYAVQHKLSGWRQVVEVIVTSARAADMEDRHVGLRLFDMLSPPARFTLFDTLHPLVEMVRDERLAVVAGQMARVVVFLLEKLRLMGTEASLTAGDGDDTLDKSMLNRSLQASMCDASVLWERVKLPVLEPDQLHQVLTGIVATILDPKATRVIRSRMYSALLHYLQLTNHAEADPDAPVVAMLAESQIAHQSINLTNMTLLGSNEHRQMVIQVGNVNILEYYGAQLVDIIAHDATATTTTSSLADASNASAYAVLNSLLRYGRRHVWMEFLTQHVEDVIVSIELEDQAVTATLQTDPQDFTALFIHEARMALLTRIAQSPDGAFALLHCNIIARLGNCQYLSVWPPESDGPASTTVMFSTVQGRFQRLLVCSLRLIAAIAATLRVQTRNATYQIVDFVLNRLPIMNRVLDDVARTIPPDSATADADTLTQMHYTEAELEPLRLLTSIFYHLRPHESHMRDRLANFATRLHTKQALLLKKYFEVDMWMHRKSPDDLDASMVGEGSPREVVENAQMTVLAIVTNLVMYFRMTARIPEDATPLPVFLCGCNRGPIEPSTLTVRDALGLLDSKVSMLAQAFTAVGPTPDVSTLTVHECRIASLQLLLVENLVWLVWQHVQFYIGRRRRDAEPVEWRITDDEMANMAKLTRKHTASLGDLLTLQESVRQQTGVDLRFSEVLLRRIRDKLSDYDYANRSAR